MKTEVIFFSVPWTRQCYPLILNGVLKNLLVCAPLKVSHSTESFIVGYPPLYYSAMQHYVPWDNWLGKSRSHE